MSIKGEYPSTPHFEVLDSMGVPHPYCITPRHLKAVTGGVLDARAIKDAEKQGAHCGVRGCQLSYEEHEQALAIKCKANPEESQKIKDELQDYCKSLIPEMESNGYVGFVFVKSWE